MNNPLPKYCLQDGHRQNMALMVSPANSSKSPAISNATVNVLGGSLVVLILKPTADANIAGMAPQYRMSEIVPLRCGVIAFLLFVAPCRLRLLLSLRP
jgi:hypothetical protein